MRWSGHFLHRQGWTFLGHQPHPRACLPGDLWQVVQVTRCSRSSEGVSCERLGWGSPAPCPNSTANAPGSPHHCPVESCPQMRLLWASKLAHRSCISSLLRLHLLLFLQFSPNRLPTGCLSSVRTKIWKVATYSYGFGAIIQMLSSTAHFPLPPAHLSRMLKTQIGFNYIMR